MMKNKYFLASIPLFMGILCFVLKMITPETLEADGTLREAFLLLPLGYLFLLSGIISLSVTAIKSKSKKH
ncbi:DUF3955 domain-containing protein [Bacillus cereus group sp. TH152-1LC]|uniref:DUF3955 domain-containing protein n=1 Tax=Bacillus cereus group sp. TH152-1LC TaxID=3018060 RepID=UPI002FD90EC4